MDKCDHGFSIYSRCPVSDSYECVEETRLAEEDWDDYMRSIED